MGRPPSFEECLTPGQPLRAEVDRDGTAKQIVEVARGLEGIVRNSSIHAAAVVISDRRSPTSCRCRSPTPAPTRTASGCSGP